MKRRVGFLTTHPIQYQVPVFRHLAESPDLDFTVYFCQLPQAATQGDGFGVAFQWDVPLLDGYHYEVLKNVARRPSVTTFNGCDTPEISRIIRSGGFDAFIVNGWVVKSCLQTLAACRLAGVPCIVRGEANDIRPRAIWKRLIHRGLLHQYSAFATIGESNSQFYRRHGISQSRQFSARYCVDNERFEKAAALVNREQARKRFNLKPDSVVYLFCGKLIDKKHPLELLSSLRLAVSGNSNIECLVVGDGELRAICEDYVREHNLPVNFAGFLNQSEIVSAYVASDCLVLPSDHGETWGLVVNEAMACGRPAIVSDQVGCASDLITCGLTGTTFRYGDWPSLGTILKELAVKPETLRQWGIQARRRIEDYSPLNAANGLRAAIEAVSPESTRRRTRQKSKV